MRRGYRTILSPMADYTYDVETQIEMEDLYNYFRQTGVTTFALLDAYSLEYYGEVCLQ